MTYFHDHYPTDIAEGYELYDDLVQFAGLGHEAALETVGYAFGEDTMLCPTMKIDEDLGGKFEGLAFPLGVETSQVNRETYLRGFKLGVDAAREKRGLAHV